MESRMVGKSENDRPVAPGPPSNRVSPENTAPSSGACQHTDPGECPGVWIAHHLRVVADDPNVVVDFPTATVEFEHPVGDNALDRATVHRVLLVARALTG